MIQSEKEEDKNLLWNSPDEVRREHGAQVAEPHLRLGLALNQILNEMHQASQNRLLDAIHAIPKRKAASFRGLREKKRMIDREEKKRYSR